MTTLKDISSRPNDTKFKLYETYIDVAVKKHDIKALSDLVEHLVQKEGADQYGRTYLTPDLLIYVIAQIGDDEGKQESPLDVEDMTPLMKKIVDLIRPKVDDFPDALMTALDLLAKCYQADNDFKSAAFTLSSFRFDDFAGKLSATVEKKVDWFVTTAEFWLQVGETGSASQQIKRAHSLLNEIKGNTQLLMRFKTCYARVLDSERKFLEAAMRYMELSQMPQTKEISEADLVQSLEYAVTCGILAKAGPPRSRVLAMLFSDERSKQLQNYGLLEKVFKERIIRNDEIVKFEKMLQEHQNAATATGRTVLQNSIIEHNMLAASKIYVNIKFDQLGVLLGIPAKEAESLAATMVEQGRMKGTIDQVEQVVEFEDDATGVLSTWDNEISEVCLVVNHTLDTIAKKHPQYNTY